MRSKCPVHWSPKITEYPDEAGFWSVTTRRGRPHGQPRLADVLVRARRDHRADRRDPAARADAGDVHRHGPAQARPAQGALPARLHAEADRRARGRDPRDRRSTCSTGSRAARPCDLVTDVAQPVVSRVIGSFMGIPPEDDEIWARLMNTTLGAGDPDLNPEGVRAVMERDVPEIFERCRKLIAERRENPTDDLTSVLVHAEVDGEKLEEHEIVMGFFLLVAAGNDSTKATYCSGMRALMEHPDAAAAAARRPARWSRRRRGGAADVPRVRPLPPHRDRGHRAQRPARSTRATRSSCGTSRRNRDETRYEDPDRFDVHRNPEHQAFGAGGRHFCLGTALARLELQDPVRGDAERATRRWSSPASRAYAASPFVNQLEDAAGAAASLRLQSGRGHGRGGGSPRRRKMPPAGRPPDRCAPARRRECGGRSAAPRDHPGR